jgi:hypothetical protein
MEQVLILSRWGARWVKHAWNILVEGNTREQFANKLLGKFTEESKEPSSYVDLHVYDSVHTVINKDGGRVVGHVERKKKVLSKGRRSNFSCAIAQLAYNKFGERPMSEANVLVTRRWIQNCLRKRSIRICVRVTRT